MPLASGDRLGPYEILGPLGAGGMGEVFKARDTRLDRFVAVKVLPDHIAQREDARLRFEREARAVASLNHPHICTLHDIGEQGGVSFLVMELLEGEPLAARIAKGPLPLDQANSVRAGNAQPLFRYGDGLGRFQASRDGQRFLVRELDPATTQHLPLVVILNWAARLGEVK